MTVAELIVELQKCEPETLVVMMRDPPDRNYAYPSGSIGRVDFEDLVYAADDGGGPEVYDLTDCDPDDVPPGSVPCCMLSPED